MLPPILPHIQRLTIDCRDTQIHKIGVTRYPNLKVGNEFLKGCVEVRRLEFIFWQHPERWNWAAMVDLLPLLNEVVSPRLVTVSTARLLGLFNCRKTWNSRGEG